MDKNLLFQSADQVARLLLGTILVHESPEGLTAGEIVETEAYLGDDPASHSFAGLRLRNAPMFGAGGTAYVYRIYGLHLCFNVVTGQPGVGEAVLVRALRPLDGKGLMAARRRTEGDRRLCNGPANLVQAMGIGISHNGISLQSEPLYLEAAPAVADEEVLRTTRIGISKGADLPLRFLIKNSPYVSRRGAVL